MLSHELRRNLSARIAAIRSLAPEALIQKSERWKHTVEALRDNGFFRLGGKTYQVLETGRYRETSDDHRRFTGDEWTEFKLFCVDTGEITYLEWEKDDNVSICLTVKELKFSDLRDDENGAIDEDDLEQISNDEDDIVYRGVIFFYEDDYAAKYFRNADVQKGDKAWMYEFESHDGQYLTIEEWTSGGKEDYQIFLSQPVHESQIEILSLGNAS